ncbi:olfactory receptor 1L8-like [Ambystoma mexicanum]|uniref:olfactory receptor 1L8-like n=1 Tax=Ambystoma mexicanum TaxID=8296 RepID=UPI0037E76977
MERGNQTDTLEFLLLGLSSHPKGQVVLFVVFLAMYLTTISGNVIIIAAIAYDSKLHNPMYACLGCFSSADISLASTVIPKLLNNLLADKKTISFIGCFTQMFFFLFAVTMENLLLGVMAFDRYAAICRPLHYSRIMTKKACSLMLAMSGFLAAMHALLHTAMASDLYYCTSNQVHHFFCDLAPLLKLSCSDTFANELVIFTEGPAMSLPFLLTVISYIQIVWSILKMRSVEGRHKAFSTCSSHFTMVTLFYGTLFFMYFRPSSSYFLDFDKVVSVVYTVLIPMLNPFIYSLRNKDVIKAMKKVLMRCPCAHKLHLKMQAT